MGTIIRCYLSQLDLADAESPSEVSYTGNKETDTPTRCMLLYMVCTIEMKSIEMEDTRVAVVATLSTKVHRKTIFTCAWAQVSVDPLGFLSENVDSPREQRHEVTPRSYLRRIQIANGLVIFVWMLLPTWYREFP